MVNKDMYQRNHIQAFENAKAKGMTDSSDWMYMYSQSNKDFFKNINFRNYISFTQNEPEQLEFDFGLMETIDRSLNMPKKA